MMLSIIEESRLLTQALTEVVTVLGEPASRYVPNAFNPNTVPVVINLWVAGTLRMVDNSDLGGCASRFNNIHKWGCSLKEEQRA